MMIDIFSIIASKVRETMDEVINYIQTFYLNSKSPVEVETQIQ